MCHTHSCKRVCPLQTCVAASSVTNAAKMMRSNEAQKIPHQTNKQKERKKEERIEERVIFFSPTSSLVHSFNPEMWIKWRCSSVVITPPRLDRSNWPESDLAPCPGALERPQTGWEETTGNYSFTATRETRATEQIQLLTRYCPTARLKPTGPLQGQNWSLLFHQHLKKKEKKKKKTPTGSLQTRPEVITYLIYKMWRQRVLLNS